MRYYDYNLAKKIINKLTNLTEVDEVVMGMHEDWFWTAQTVWEEGKYLHPLPENADELEEKVKQENPPFFETEKDENNLPILNKRREELTKHQINGVYGSSWATPVLSVRFADGTEKVFNCYKVKGEDINIENTITQMNNWANGCLSGSVTNNRLLINLEDFKD